MTVLQQLALFQILAAWLMYEKNKKDSWIYKFLIPGIILLLAGKHLGTSFGWW
jgi:hypothetical protein